MSPSTAWRTDTHLIYYPPAEASESRLLTGLREKAAKAKAVPTAQATHFSSIAKEVCVDV